MNADAELLKNREYQRILAALAPEEKLRLLGAAFDLQRQLDKKREYRRLVSELPLGQKLSLLDELRKRAQLLQGRRRTAPRHLDTRADEADELDLPTGREEESLTRKGDSFDRFGGALRLAE